MENLTRRRFAQPAAMAMAAEPLCEADSATASLYTGVIRWTEQTGSWIQNPPQFDARCLAGELGWRGPVR